MDLPTLLTSILLGGVAMVLVAHLLRGFRVGGLGTALLAGLVYGVLHGLLQGVLIILSLPLVVLTLGLFILVINGFLLWLTTKIVPRFSARSAGTLIGGALLLSLLDFAFHVTLGHSALF